MENDEESAPPEFESVELFGEVDDLKNVGEGGSKSGLPTHDVTGGISRDSHKTVIRNNPSRLSRERKNGRGCESLARIHVV